MTLARTTDTAPAAESGASRAFSPGIDWGLNTDLEAVTGSREPSVFICEQTDFVFACGVASPVEALALIRAYAEELFLPEAMYGKPTLPTDADLDDFRLRWCRAMPSADDGEFEYVEGPDVPGAFPAVVWNP